MLRRAYDAVFNRPFWDGKTMRRRYPGEARGFNAPLIVSQLLGALIVLGPVAGMIAAAKRIPTLGKKPIIPHG